MPNFPSQKLTTAEKISKYGSLDKFAEEMLTSVEGISGFSYGTFNDRNYSRAILHDLANGVLNSQDLDYVLKPYGELSPRMPGELRYYDRISSKLNTLYDDEIKRPFTFRAAATDINSVNSMLKERSEMVLKMIDDWILKEIEKEQSAPIQGQTQQQQPQQETPGQPPVDPRKFNEYANTTYKSEKEISLNHMLQYLKEKLHVEEVFNEGFKDLYKSGDDIYYTGIRNGDPSLRKVNPFNFFYDRSSETKYIEDSAWALEYRWVPASMIYDEFGDLLTDKQIEQIEQMKGDLSSNVGFSGSGAPIQYYNENESPRLNSDYGYYIGSNCIVKVTHFVWKSLKKVGFISYQDLDTGEILEKVVDEKYKMNYLAGDISIKWEWINETWETTRIGKDVAVGTGPRESQYRSVDNPQKTRLPYTGISDPSMSVIGRVREMIYLYCIYMYRLEIEIAKSGGKVLLFDTAQIPRSDGFTMEDWLYHLKSDGIAFINSFEEGKRGSSSGQRSTFNQFQALDLSMSQVVAQFVQILNYLDQIIVETIGVTPQKQGQIDQYESAFGTQQAVTGSNASVSYLYYSHDEVKRRVLTNLLEETKVAWKGGKKAKFITSNLTEIILNVDDSVFIDTDFDVFMSNAEKDIRSKQFIESYAGEALKSNQARIGDILKVMNTDSISESALILENSLNKIQAETQQFQLQQQQQQQQADLQKEQMISDREERKMLNDNEQRQLDREYELKKAEIEAQRESAKSSDMPVTSAPHELAAAQLDVAKHQHEVDVNVAELRLKNKELDLKAATTAAELQVERENMKNDLQIADKNAKGRAKSSPKK